MRNYFVRVRLGSSKSLLAGVAVATAIAVVAPSAQAELLTFGTNTTPGFFGFAVAPVDINGPLIAGTTLTFAGCIPGTPVMITYSAECSHSGTLAQWGTIQILLNGVVLSPTMTVPGAAPMSGAIASPWRCLTPSRRRASSTMCRLAPMCRCRASTR